MNDYRLTQYTQSHSILGILNSIFPWMIADTIFNYVMDFNKNSVISEFNKLNKKIHPNGILGIKCQQLAAWIVTYEKIYKDDNKYRWTDTYKQNRDINQILLNNHICLQGWKKRQNVKYTKILQNK